MRVYGPHSEADAPEVLTVTVTHPGGGKTEHEVAVPELIRRQRLQINGAAYCPECHAGVDQCCHTAAGGRLAVVHPARRRMAVRALNSKREGSA